MKRIDFIGPLGVVLVMAAYGWSREHTLPGGMPPILATGAFLVLLHLFLRWDAVVGGVGRRQMKYGANTLVAVLVVFGILAGINYLASRRFKRFDLTKGQRFSLSDQTKKVVSGLTQDIKITYFDRAQGLARGQDRLKEYQALSDKLKVEFVEPIKNPAKAQAYDVRGPWPILVIEKGSSKERATNDSEQDITNAIIKVTREQKKTICFQEGEGERDIDDSSERGFSGAKGALGKSQYETKKVLLLREAKVPAECTVFVVGGPEKDVVPQALSPLRDYLKNGGKLLVLAEAPLKGSTPNLDGFLKEFNVEAGQDVVVDVSPMGQLFGTSEFTPLAMSYPQHEITKDFRVATAYHTARSVKAGTASVEGVFAQNLIETAPQSWAETDLSLKGRIEYDEGKDTKGPIALGVVATVRGQEPTPAPSASPSASPAPAVPEEKPKAPEGKLVAIGDVDFASNTLLAFQGNQDFFLNTVAWLAEDADLISVRPKEQDDQRMILTLGQKQNVAWIALALIPGLFVVLGIVTWWRRR